MFKRFSILLTCLIIIIVSTPFCYATDLPTGYTPVTDSVEVARAFNDYCKSRDCEFTSAVPGATYTYIYNYMKKCSKLLGSDLDAMNEGLYKSISQAPDSVKWYISASTMNGWNEIFSYFIRENNLEVGDPASLNVYDGKYLEDRLLYICNSTGSNNVVSQGTPVLHAASYYQELPTPTSLNDSFSIYGTTYNFNFEKYYSSDNSQIWGYGTVSANNNSYASKAIYRYRVRTDVTNNLGNLALAYNTATEKYYLGVYYDLLDNGLSSPKPNTFQSIVVIDVPVSELAPQSVNINFVTIDNRTINNNVHEGDTIINNNGDVINNPQPGGEDPGWDVSGGQGTYDDGNGNTYNITFPDFELPDLNIDWSINGLGNKFPFSIPFDIAALVSVLNAEPEAPRFQGTLDLGITTYDYDINLAQFDTVASACRIAELLLLVFGLIMITRSIIKG